MGQRCKGTGVVPPVGSAERNILDKYQTACRDNGLLDFEDMYNRFLRARTAATAPATATADTALRVCHTGRILCAASALRQAGNRASTDVDHLLLDEAQDTSESQLALLKLLAPRGIVNITAVGDADQTIYSFRGSRPDVLSRIGTHWRCQTLILPTNYRCGGAIVSAARSLIESSSLREVATPLLAARNLSDVGSVQVHAHSTRDEELQRLAEAHTEELCEATRPEIREDHIRRCVHWLQLLLAFVEDEEVDEWRGGGGRGEEV